MMPFVAWFGMSLGIAYFEGRDRVREAVWYEDAGLVDRLNRIFRMGENFEFYDFNNPKHIAAIDLRLNQNNLVGGGILRHEGNQIELLYGETVPLWVFVPRAFWPESHRSVAAAVL